MPYNRQQYANHLSSAAWLNSPARLACLKRARGRCGACGRRVQLHVHHWTYAHLGHERAWELVALCGLCHLWFAHGLATLLFGRRTRGLLLTTSLTIIFGLLVMRPSFALVNAISRIEFGWRWTR